MSDNIWLCIEHLYARLDIKTALIITSYNWPEALDLVLSTVANQHVMPDYIVIADDGSDERTHDVIGLWKGNLPLRHIWQSDSGFRAARVRNLAALKSDAEHLVFIDGDCLLPPSFIENHRNLVRPGLAIAGSRYLLNRRRTLDLVNGSGKISGTAFFHPKFMNIPLGILRDTRPHAWHTFRSCNFGLMSADFFASYGFDEAYKGWGREDSDLIVRMLNLGLAIRSGRLATCVLHLDHPSHDRKALKNNNYRFSRVISDDSISRPVTTSLGEL